MTGAEVAVALARVSVDVPVVSTRHFAAPRGSRGFSRPAPWLDWAPDGGSTCRWPCRITSPSGSTARAPSSPAASHPPRPTGHLPRSRDRVVLVRATARAREAHRRRGPRVRPSPGSRTRGGGSTSRATALCFRGGFSRWPSPRASVTRWTSWATVPTCTPSWNAPPCPLVAPCPIEAFGLSVVEAMARSLPVVAAAAGAHLETVGSVDGAALFPPTDDPADAARWLEKLAGDESAPRRLRRPAPDGPAAALHRGGPGASYRRGRPPGASCDRPRRAVPGVVGRRVASQPAPRLAPARRGHRPLRVLFVEPPADPLHGLRRRDGLVRVQPWTPRRAPRRRGRPAVAVPAHQVAAPTRRPVGRPSASRLFGRPCHPPAGDDPARPLAQRPRVRRPAPPYRLARPLRHHRRLARRRPIAPRARPAGRATRPTSSPTAATRSSAHPGCSRPRPPSASP